MLLLRDSYFKGLPFSEVKGRAAGIIKSALPELKNSEVAAAAQKSLENYTLYAWTFLLLGLGTSGLAVKQKYETAQGMLSGKPITFDPRAKGVPTQRYAKTYMAEVAEKLREFSRIEALDPDDRSGRNSLRNRAEMEVRYAAHMQRIEELKAKGVRLVVCSAHADCSDRCFPFQGRVYSLDGTSGTIDGLSFVPLEKATDIFYTTKTGKVYKNGLLGFNCRHYLYEYVSGMALPSVSKSEQRRENAINIKQRQYEAQVRKWRDEALVLKDIDRDGYLAARQKAIIWNKRYQKFSQDNGRAYYPDRVKILA